MQIYKHLKLILLSILIFFANEVICLGQQNLLESESIFGLEEPEEYKNSIKTPGFLDGEKIETPFILPRPVGGFGNLHVIIETIDALNEKVISQKADRAELWLGHNMISRLDVNDVKVFESSKGRYFDFPITSLRTGYYFISIRLYSNGFLWKNKKFHEEIFQVGIHEGQTTTLRRKVPFLHW